jgi:hypothetical protein
VSNRAVSAGNIQGSILNRSARGLTVEISGHGPTKLFDMSYEGAALTQPLTQAVTQVGVEVELRFQTQVDQASLKAEVIRTSADTVAVRFLDVGVTARIIIDRLVTDRIIGLNMNLIDPKHYAADVDFTHWYHGPKETNVYLWWRAGQLTRGQLEMATATVTYDGEDLFLRTATPRTRLCRD